MNNLEKKFKEYLQDKFKEPYQFGLVLDLAHDLAEIVFSERETLDIDGYYYFSERDKDGIVQHYRIKAQKPITRDRVINAMKKYMCELSGDVPIAYAGRIATEILGKEVGNE